MNTMKTTAGILFLLLLAFSCKKEEEKDFASIQGKWQGTRAEVEFRPFGLPIPFSEEDESFGMLLEFKGEGTMIVHENQATTGTYEVIGDKLIIDVDLTVADRNLGGTYKLETLNASTLAFYREEENQKFADPDGGPSVRGDLKFTLHFRKVN